MTMQLRSNKKCITHHYACDCREDYFADLVDENDRLKKRVKAAETLLKTFELNEAHEVLCGRLEVTKAALSAFWKDTPIL